MRADSPSIDHPHHITLSNPVSQYMPVKVSVKVMCAAVALSSAAHYNPRPFHKDGIRRRRKRAKTTHPPFQSSARTYNPDSDNPRNDRTHPLSTPVSQYMPVKISVTVVSAAVALSSAAHCNPRSFHKDGSAADASALKPPTRHLNHPLKLLMNNPRNETHLSTLKTRLAVHAGEDLGDSGECGRGPEQRCPLQPLNGAPAHPITHLLKPLTQAQTYRILSHR